VPPPYAVEPGTRLVDRYLLEARLGQAGSTTYWRARDELLDRAVGICLLDVTASDARSILRAARQAAAVNDARFLRVLDASETDKVVYVVTEWVTATSLAELLADGPMSPTEARAMVVEIAEALAAAHEQGLAHLCLQPEHILRTAHDQIKVSGLAVDAAVRGITAVGAAEAARLDVAGCAGVLYAALTARWPGGGHSTLPPAPRENGELCSPRQVRAGIPDDLDELTCRGLAVPNRAPAAEPLAGPADLAAALATASTTTRMAPVRAPEGAGSGDTPYPPAYFAAYDDESPRRRRMMARGAWVLAALLLAAGVALVGWQLLMAVVDNKPPATGATSSASGSAATGQGPIKVASVESFDPPPGDGEENNSRVRRVLDGNTGTVWTTKTYFDPFGQSGIKEGVGLLLDLGRRQSVGSVAVALRGGGTDLEMRVADERGDRARDYRVVAQATGATGLVELKPPKPVQARYVLIWLTSLPQEGADYRGTIAEVGVRG
jgi:hypothetical protein